MKLLWTVKRWEPGITTHSTHQDLNRGAVYVGIDYALIVTDFRQSHAAAAAWAADKIGASMEALGRGLGGRR